MQNQNSRVSVLAMLLCFFIASPVMAQEGMEQMSDSLVKAKQVEFMQANQPGPEHERLAKLAGKWEVIVSYWTEPGAAPVTDTAEAASEMVLGGRFLKTETTGSMMGMPVETISYIGFDGRHKKYSYVGFDNMGTYWVSAFGKFDDETNTIEMSGTDEDPIFDFTQIYDIEIELVDENLYITRVIFKDDFHTKGEVEEFKQVEVVAKRVN